MTERTMQITWPPVGPLKDTLERPGALIMARRADGGTILVTWCWHTRAGAVFHTDLQRWAINVPMDLGDFLVSLGDRRYMLPDGPDRETWLDAITPPPAEAAH